VITGDITFFWEWELAWNLFFPIADLNVFIYYIVY